MSLAKLWAIAQAERRIIVGQLIYWLFLIIAYIDAIGIFVMQGLAHASYSTLSTTAGFPSPRNAIFYVAHYYLIIFIMAVVFLSLDIRGRDSRSRMLEILDSRPYTNLDLIFGRFIGWFLCAWTPILVLMFILPAIGWLLPQIFLPAGGEVEPLALLGFAFYMAVPALAFCCSLVLLITLIVGHRIAALIVSVILIGGSYFLLAFQPFSIALAFDLLGTLQVNQPSEWVPSIANVPWWIQRGGLLVMVVGFLLFSAALHPRLDGSNRKLQAVAALVFTSIGVGLVMNAYQRQQAEFEQIDQWRLAHEEFRDRIFPDVLSIEGRLEINPGQLLTAELELTFQAPIDQNLDSALFTLNPGLAITQLTSANGQPIVIDHQNGLLNISLRNLPGGELVAGSQTTVHLSYQGLPNNHFGYLDTAIDISTTTVSIDNRAVYSIENGIFDEGYVALMPGIHWLPSAGVDIGRSNGYEQEKDFYSLLLDVQLPPTWTVAGPGYRQEVSKNSEFAVYNFSPATIVPEVALLAAPFTTYTAEIEGIQFEMLLHPNHDKIITGMSGAEEEIEKWIAEKISLARDAGLEYPFRSFSLVDAPNTLRGYKGGWRMESSLTPPAMVLVKEKGLPTARFDVSLESLDGIFRRMNLPEGVDDPALIALNRLVSFVNNDFSGSNILAGFAQSFFTHQTAATGPESIALNYALGELASLTITGERSYYSTERAITLDETMDEILDRRYDLDMSTTAKVIENFTSEPAVWESALTAPLSAIDPWSDPTLTTDVLTLKSGKLAEVIYDTLGARGSGQLLAELLAEHRGKAYTSADVAAVASSLQGSSQQLATLLDSWINEKGLAGFATDQVQLYQLPDNQNGESSYQLKLRINNAEDVSGFGRVSWTTEAEGDRSSSEPILIPANSAVEFGLVLSQPPVAAFLEPYLSLNRKEFRVQTFNNSRLVESDAPAFDGIRATSLKVTQDDRIIIDDLDPGFRIIDDEVQREGLLIGLFDIEEPVLDQGLPVRSYGFPGRWSRRSVDGAWGKYRHTIAYINRSDRNRRAAFSAAIPEAGRWVLETHFPAPFFDFDARDLYGDWNLILRSSDGSEEIVFAAAGAVEGWNLIGEYELPAGEVSLEFKTQSNGRLIVADAISWSLKK